MDQISYMIKHKKELSDQNDQAYISKVEEAFEGICERLKNDQGENTDDLRQMSQKTKTKYTENWHRQWIKILNCRDITPANLHKNKKKTLLRTFMRVFISLFALNKYLWSPNWRQASPQNYPKNIKKCKALFPVILIIKSAIKRNLLRFGGND